MKLIHRFIIICLSLSVLIGCQGKGKEDENNSVKKEGAANQTESKGLLTPSFGEIAFKDALAAAQSTELADICILDYRLYSPDKNNFMFIHEGEYFSFRKNEYGSWEMKGNRGSAARTNVSDAFRQAIDKLSRVQLVSRCFDRKTEFSLELKDFDLSSVGQVSPNAGTYSHIVFIKPYEPRKEGQANRTVTIPVKDGDGWSYYLVR